MKMMRCGIAAIAALVVASGAHAATGQQIYAQNCAMCHDNNVGPKPGDKAAWAPRLALGTGALVAAVINGKGMMPPRGGHPGLSDADIKAAVEYIENSSK